jgi:Kef-type K+ transport system membrane component KefB
MNSSLTVRAGIGLSNTLGAFLAGLLLAETKYRYQIEADIAPFRGLLLGFFFITVGFNIDLGMRWPTPHSSFSSPIVFVAHKRAFTLPPSLTSYDVAPCT